MADLLRTWIQNIVVIMVLATFIELILPSENFKPYMKFVLSLVVMLVILQPVVEMLRGSDNILNDLTQLQGWVNQEENRHATRIEALDQDKMVVEVYQELIEDKIKTEIENATGKDLVALQVTIVEDPEAKDFGLPSRIDVEFATTQQDDLITPVIINIGDQVKKNQSEEQSSDEQSQLTQQINSLLQIRYGIPPDSVNIHFLR